MPKYRVKSPDGKTYDVTAPDGASQEEVLAFAQKHYGGGAGSDTPAPAADAAEPGFFEGIPQQFGADLRTVARGVASIPDIVAAPLTAGFNSLMEKPRTTADLVAGREPGRYFPEQYNFTQSVDYLADLAGLARNEPSKRTAALEGGASVLGSLGVGTLLKPLGGVAGEVGKMLTAQPTLQVASGATGGAAAEGAREAGAGAGGQLVAGLAGGLAPGIASLPRAGARAARNPQLGALAAEGAARDIPIRPIAGGSRVVEVLRNLPLTGANNRYGSDVAAMNKAVARAIGVDAPVVTPAVYAAKKAEDSRVLNELMSRNNVQVDQPFLSRLVAIDADAATSGDDVQRTVRAAIDRFTSQAEVGPGGKISVPGEAYQSLDTRLGKVSKTNPAYPYIQDLQKTIRNQMDQSISPEDSARWAKWRQEFGDRKTISKLVAEAQGKPLDPRGLMEAVNVRAFNGTERLASGTRGEMGTLAKIGQNIVPPNTNRAILPVGTIAAAGTGTFVPSAAAPLAGLALLSNLAGRAADAPWLTRFLSRAARESKRAEKFNASATGAAVGANSQRNNEED